MGEITSQMIREICKAGKLHWTNHIVVRLLQRGITAETVEQALLNCQVIEQYPEAYPYPACLTMGIDIGSKNIHVVCGICEDEIWLITAYYPDLNEWNIDFRTRKEQ